METGMEMAAMTKGTKSPKKDVSLEYNNIYTRCPQPRWRQVQKFSGSVLD